MFDAIYSRDGEEVDIVVTVLEEVFHLSGCPFYTKCLASSSVLHFNTSCASSSGISQWKVFGTTVSWLSLAKGLMAGMIGMVMPILRAFSTKVIELLVVVEELGNGIRCAQLLLLQQVLHIHFQVWSLLMLLWIASYAAAEFLARMLDGSSIQEETVIELVHLLQKVGGMGMTILGRCELPVFLRLVATQYEDVADAQKLEVEQFVLNVFLGSTAADDVRDDRNVVLVLDGTCNGDGARAATHTLASQETVFQFLVYILAVVCGNVDKPWDQIPSGCRWCGRMLLFHYP